MTLGEDYLFGHTDWFSIRDRYKQAMLKEIDAVEGNRLLNTSVDDLCRYIEKKYTINVPSLNRDGIVVDQHEAKIDVSHDPRRFILDRRRPIYVDGTAIEVVVPFTGDAEMFSVQPSRFTSNPPRAQILNNNLKILIQGTDLTSDRVTSIISNTLSSIESYLDWQRNDVRSFNDQIFEMAKEKITRRRKKLLRDQDLVSSLGFALKQRENSAQTYVAPEIRRRVAPKMPAATTAPYVPEPTLSDDDFEHILSIIDNMAEVMERSPSAFKSMDEEAIRTHFLVQLNGHYQGQATGETFNFNGKTDILIRVKGKNIFIAECKFWSGPKALTETVDQLLGYASWRDTKVAIILFNRQRNFTHILKSIPEAIGKHPNCKRTVGRKSETISRYVFSHKDDPNRELVLVVMAFDVPI